MPFLYQTRTLAGTHWVRSPRIVNEIYRRNLSTASDMRDSRDGDVKFVVRRTGHIHNSGLRPHTFGSKSPQYDSQQARPIVIKRYVKDFKTSSAPHRLRAYQRDGKGVSNKWESVPREREITFSGRPKDEFDEFEKARSIPFEGPENSSEEMGDVYEETDAIDALTIKSDPRNVQDSTITQSEKQVFQKLFADIFTNLRDPQQGEAASLVDRFDSEEHEQSQPTTHRSRDLLGSIMNRAVVERTPVRTREQMENIVAKYPLALRPAAARAIGLDEAKDEVEEDFALDGATTRLEELQNVERDRVEALMRSAETDFALWKVMEEEVFSLIAKLNLGDYEMDSPKEESPVKKGKKKLKQEKKTKASPAAQKPIMVDIVGDGISALSLYGPLYPSYLLLGLRLLDRSFSKPSLLTLSILPRIKELGRISHVLGGSTQLYNELIFIHWYRRDDFRGAYGLLSEMEKYCLDWDLDTLNIVEQIGRTQRTIKAGKRGHILQALWEMPEFSPGQFKVWSQKIKQAIEERNEDGVRSLSYQ